eukprot:TRINITY_DN72805_c0_g1_i1.p1 TRINITY_DN72805_c0_g1~~TRINITY_DN72805_c0_g1_i1.p1  ORF type:complete len:430 (+),score=70.15 TRINITY_DN72805_c0_g1_i1:167-1456(+)
MKATYKESFRPSATTRGGSSESALYPPATPPSGEQTLPSTTRGPKANFGAVCLANIGKSADNQDAFVASASTSGSKYFVGVFDGHGEKGGYMSDFAKSTLTRSLFSRRELHSDPKAALEGAYRETQHQIEAKHGGDATWSGTTAVSAYQHRDRLFVANVGDSRAVLGRCPTAKSGQREQLGLQAVELSSDHKPCRPDERARIVDQGGIVRQGAYPVQSPMGMRFVRMGPERVMDRNGMGGLAMSRSLGDLSLRPYVSSTPEVYERQLSRKDKCLILGTDGVWDYVSSQEAVDIAGRYRDPQQAAREITSVAKRRWQDETQGMLTDDITAVVVSLDHGSVASSPAVTHRSTMPPGRSWAPRGSQARTTSDGGLFETESNGFGQVQRRSRAMPDSLPPAGLLSGAGGRRRPVGTAPGRHSRSLPARSRDGA